MHFNRGIGFMLIAVLFMGIAVYQATGDRDFGRARYRVRGVRPVRNAATNFSFAAVAALSTPLLAGCNSQKDQGREKHPIQRESASKPQARAKLKDLEAAGYKRLGDVRLVPGGTCDKNGKCVTWFGKGYYLGKPDAGISNWLCRAPSESKKVKANSSDVSEWACEKLNG